MLLQIGWAYPAAPPGHGLSRVADHMESQASRLPAANDASWRASDTVNTSVAVSFTPIIGVTATCAHASASVSPSTLFTCAWVAVAASMANWPIRPAGLGA